MQPVGLALCFLSVCPPVCLSICLSIVLSFTFYSLYYICDENKRIYICIASSFPLPLSLLRLPGVLLAINSLLTYLLTNIRKGECDAMIHMTLNDQTTCKQRLRSFILEQINFSYRTSYRLSVSIVTVAL